MQDGHISPLVPYPLINTPTTARDTPPVDPSRLRIPDTHSLSDCIRYWEVGDNRRGLTLPLSVWPSTFKPSSYRSEAVKWGKIQKVVHEFRVVCKSDHKEFDTQYPGLLTQYAKLFKAVNVARQSRGELVERPNRRRREEVPEG